jgi:peptidoglycan/LPS O-acetylase OafA/YrhL
MPLTLELRLRGICACMVALFHFKSYGSGNLSEVMLVQNAYLFVDFFFVLSGFIIFENYFCRLGDGFGIMRFMALRLGRLYPLHIFMLGLFLLYEITWALVLHKFSSNPRPAFEGPTGVGSLGENILLLNAMGLRQEPSWNYPSWSIGAEFYTYLLFAVAIVLLGRRINMGIVLLGIAGFAVLIAIGPASMQMAELTGLPRCIYGFAIGALLSRLRVHSAPLDELSAGSSTLLECAVIVISVAFVILSGHNWGSFAAPLVFALPVLVFSTTRGNISRLLEARALLLLGKLSYSIYMVHVFVMLIVANLVSLLERLTSLQMTTPVIVEGALHKTIRFAPWQGDIAIILLLGATILFASATYRLIESPSRDWSRNVAARIRF